jgi:hypothetical protein
MKNLSQFNENMPKIKERRHYWTSSLTKKEADLSADLHGFIKDLLI